MSVKENLNEILEETKNYNPTIVAVTKYYDEKKMMEAYDAGLRNFAESRALEAVEKIGKIDDTAKSQSIYHFIGHLQTNKVKHVVGVFHYIHSIDSLKIAKAVDQRASELGIIQKIFLQVNNADEVQKFGISPNELENLIEEVRCMKSLDLVGLMNIAPLTDDIQELHRLFKQMKALQEEYQLKELSMGMSHDYKIALEEGATMIRLGRILFKDN